MARRLIFAQSVFMEMEEAMISRLKVCNKHCQTISTSEKKYKCATVHTQGGTS